MRHGEDVAVEDAKLGVKGQNGVLALVVLAAAAVCFCKKACNTRGLLTPLCTRVCSRKHFCPGRNLPRSPDEGALLPVPHHRVPGTINPRLTRWRLLPFDPSSCAPGGDLSTLLTDLFPGGPPRFGDASGTHGSSAPNAESRSKLSSR